MLFTGLAKFDGNRQRVLKTREFLQIAGRAGRAGFDTAGFVVVQAPEHVIDNEKAKAKSEAKNKVNPKKKSKPQLKKPPEGTVVWSEQTFDKLVAGEPEKLASRMRVDNAMLVNVLSRPEDAFEVLRRLLTENHEPRRQQLRLARRALRLTRSLVRSGTVTRLDEPDEHGRRYVLTVDLPEDFALNQPLAHFALAAFDVLDPEADDVRARRRQRRRGRARGAAAGADGPAARRPRGGSGGDEGRRDRVRRADGAARPDHLAAAARGAARGDVRDVPPDPPWLPEDALGPKSVLREMWEQAMGFTDFVRRYELARSEGLVLRYLSDAYRTLRQTVPDAHRSPDLETIIEWLGETIRQTDSSLIDEWEALSHPDEVLAHRDEPAPPPRPLSAQERVLTAMVRNAMFARVAACARDDLDALMRLERAAADHVEPPRDVVMTRSRWDAALEDYYREHETLATDNDARGPAYFWMGAEEVGEPAGAPEGTTARLRQVRQTLADPADHRDWVIEAVVDLDATDAAGELVLAATALRSLTGAAVREPDL